MGSQSAEWIMSEYEDNTDVLSQENIDKLNEHALYKCKPSVKYRGKLYESNLYHCCNWTFKVRKYLNGDYYMRDTYWSSGDGLNIKLTDENFDEFELIADMRDLKQIREFEVEKYRDEDTLYLALDSGGTRYGKHFLKKDAKKNKDKILENLDCKIDSCKRKLESLQQDKEMILNNEEALEWY